MRPPPSMHPLQASWDRTRGHLRAAERVLGGAPHPACAEYRDNLDHNELELALDALDAAGRDLGASPAFWRALAAAATEMGLTGRGAAYAARGGGGDSGDVAGDARHLTPSSAPPATPRVGPPPRRR